MASKNLKAVTATGSIVYCIVKREVDAFLLNDADGSFSAAPVDPYLALAEHAVILGLFEVFENRLMWDNGFYEVVFYNQTGGFPTPVADIVISNSLIYIKTDSEQTIADTLSQMDSIFAFIVSYRRILNSITDRFAVVEKQMTSMASDILDLQKAVSRISTTPARASQSQSESEREREYQRNRPRRRET
jgi:hypothetical protein